MGKSTSIVYSEPVDDSISSKTETAVYRSPEYKDDLTTTYAANVQTLQDALHLSFQDNKEKPLLGTRERISEKELGAYEFKTYQQVEEIVQHLGSGIMNLNLAPQTCEYKDYTMRLIGIFSKNVEEWMLLDMAAAAFSFTLVPLYEAHKSE